MLYDNVDNQNTDGAPTQKAVHDALYGTGTGRARISIGKVDRNPSDGSIILDTWGISSVAGGERNIVLNRSGNASFTGGVSSSIMIGGAKMTGSTASINIGGMTNTNELNTLSGSTSIAIAGGGAVANEGAVAIGGWEPKASGKGSVALGTYSNATQQGEVNIGTTNTSYGYSSSNYRLLSGLHDGQSDHDAVTVEQVNTVIDVINSALNTSIEHIGSAS